MTNMLNTVAEKAELISDYAIIVNPNDNVAVVKTAISAGLTVLLPSGRPVVLKISVPPGHRFATSEIPRGEFVRQYGQPIGTSLGIASGEWITHDNMTDDVPVVRDLPDDLETSAPDYFPPEQIKTFMGFRRADGRVGTRNYILIVPTSMCASHEATQISMMSEFLHYSR